MIKKNAKWCRGHPQHRTTEEGWKRRVAELKEKQKKVQAPDTTVVKSLMGDRTREANTFDVKDKQVVEDLKKAKENMQREQKRNAPVNLKRWGCLL